MSNKQLTDAQLSERVCKALGIAPKIKHDLSLCDLHGNPWQTGPLKCTCTPEAVYPNVLDWPGFGRVVERLRELNVYVSTYVHPDTVEVEVVPVKGCYHGEDEKSLPRALALAVLQWEASRRGVE